MKVAYFTYWSVLLVVFVAVVWPRFVRMTDDIKVIADHYRKHKDDK